MGQIVATASWESKVVRIHHRCEMICRNSFGEYGLKGYIDTSYNISTPPAGTYVDKTTIPRIQDYSGYEEDYIKGNMKWCSIMIEQPWLTWLGGPEMVSESIKEAMEAMREELLLAGATNIRCSMRENSGNIFLSLGDLSSVNEGKKIAYWKQESLESDRKSYGTVQSLEHENTI